MNTYLLIAQFFFVCLENYSLCFNFQLVSMYTISQIVRIPVKNKNYERYGNENWTLTVNKCWWYNYFTLDKHYAECIRKYIHQTLALPPTKIKQKQNWDRNPKCFFHLKSEKKETFSILILELLYTYSCCPMHSENRFISHWEWVIPYLYWH